jgi:hypothetical protein
VVDILAASTDLASLGVMLRSKISAKVFVHRELRDVIPLDIAADPDT